MRNKFIFIMILLNVCYFKGGYLPREYVEVVKISSVSKPMVFTNDFLLRQRIVESGDRQHAVSPSGAIGVAQFMPSTWMWLKAKGVLHKKMDINNKTHQIIAQRLYMEYLFHRPWGEEFNLARSVCASYNWGRSNVLRLQRNFGLEWEMHLPKETKNYLKKLFDGFG